MLEDGDVLVIPERSSIVMVHGEVTHPTAISYDSRSTVADYVELAGGTIQRRSDTRILLVRQDGTFAESNRDRPNPGDEIIVLPRVGVRSLEVARGITQILFQIAVVAQVALNLSTSYVAWRGLEASSYLKRLGWLSESGALPENLLPPFASRDERRDSPLLRPSAWTSPNCDFAIGARSQSS